MALKNPLSNIDYKVGCDDFLLYELGRLVEEERAAFEDDEFRRVIESGIHEHIERRIDVRAELAFRLRSSASGERRLIQAVEDIETPLREIPLIIQSYAAYLFERLEQCAEAPPDDRVTTAADVLLDAPDNREAAGPAIEFLGSIRSAVSARVLAHVVSEPMLDEDMEAKAYSHLREMWPLARPYVLYMLRPHTHEDLPYRWFELLLDCGEPSAVDRILEEMLVHGGDDEYREDLAALAVLLKKSKDPELDAKILQVLNSEETPARAVSLLEDFLRTTETQRKADADSPWAALQRTYAANRQYLAAAKLFDAGKKDEAARKIGELLIEDPQNPLALMLKQLL